MGNSSSAAARSVRFALVVLVSLAFGLVLGYSTAPALKWLGKRIAAAEPSQPVSLDSYASRRTEPVISAKADSDSPSERHPLMPLVGRVDADKRFDVNANAVPRQASVDWPLTASPKAVSATSDEGYLSPTLRAGPNVQDSRLGRPVQTDDLRALSSVRTVTHPGEHRESKTHWDYCGNPQCRLCYPVAGSFSRREKPLTSDTGLPDMPQGYCKRHPQSRDCKPIVVPAPKPLPKATDPPVIASAGLGVVSRETLMILPWLLVCVLAWRNFSARRRFRLLTSQLDAWLIAGKWPDFNTASASIERLIVENRKIRRLVQDWLDKQGHDRCWYYPEIFEQLARALDLQHIVLKPPQLPSLSEYKAGCERYQREQLLAAGVTPKIPEAVMRDMPVWSEEIKRKHLSVIRPLSVSEGHIPEAARCDPSDLCSLHKPCAKHGGKLPHPALFPWGTNSDERGTDST